MELLAGTSGYAYKEWKPRFYPKEVKPADFLPYYGERLPTVEINNTFYRMPKRSVVEAWGAQVPDGFQFVLKASRRVTHIMQLKHAEELIAFIFTSAAALGDKLGPVLFQLPPYLRKDIALLKDFLAVLPAGRRVVFEFRHRSWFDDDVYDVLRGRDAALCLQENDDDNKTAPFVQTASFGYLRLRKHEYSDEELDGWHERIAAQTWQQAYVFFKHESGDAAPVTAVRFRDRAR